jgi:hypothetical protein
MSRTGPWLGAAVMLVSLNAPVEAQPASAPEQVTRADVTATASWLAVKEESGGPFSHSQWHHTLFGGAGAGVYWNDHWKTEVDLGAGGESTHFSNQQLIVDGLPAFATTESTFSRRIVGVSQQYQFFRNAWFHPHVAAGAEVIWERITDVRRPVVIFDRPGPGRVLQPEVVDGPRTDVSVHPFVATGFKAYMTPRGFFRSDIRLGFREGIDEVQVRFGFGVDF